MEKNHLKKVLHKESKILPLLFCTGRPLNKPVERAVELNRQSQPAKADKTSLMATPNTFPKLSVFANPKLIKTTIKLYLFLRLIHWIDKVMVINKSPK